MKIFKLGCIAMLMITTGCATYGSLEDYWGKSYQTAKSNQILNQAASSNLKPVEGLNGKAADAAVKKYLDSFAAPPPGQNSSATANKDYTN